MKKLLLSLSIVIAAIALVACSKKGNNGQAPGYPYGNYGLTPNDPRCMGYGFQQPGVYPTPHQQMYPGQQIYPGGYPGQFNQLNCGGMYGGYNTMNFMGSCDFRFTGRGPLCPPGFTCTPMFGSSMGVCARTF